MVHTHAHTHTPGRGRVYPEKARGLRSYNAGPGFKAGRVARAGLRRRCFTSTCSIRPQRWKGSKGVGCRDAWGGETHCDAMPLLSAYGRWPGRRHERRQRPSSGKWLNAFRWHDLPGLYEAPCVWVLQACKYWGQVNLRDWRTFWWDAVPRRCGRAFEGGLSSLAPDLLSCAAEVLFSGGAAELSHCLRPKGDARKTVWQHVAETSRVARQHR